MTKKFQKPLTNALGAAVVATFGAASLANADTNPFGMSDLGNGYMQVAEAEKEGSCGEGKCGGDKMKKAEGSCGEGKCGGDKTKKAEGSCGEGKCGGDKMKKTEGSCGEGKCGGKKSESKDGSATKAIIDGVTDSAEEAGTNAVEDAAGGAMNKAMGIGK